MPKRTAADEEAVLAMYLECGSGREAARRLGLHEQTVYQILRRFKGKCRSCPATIQPGQSHCADCRAKHAERARVKRKERMRAGVCILCDETISPPSRQYCEAHRLAHLIKNDTYRDRHFTRGTQNERQREKSIRNQYGPGALEAWKDANGCCEICGTPHSPKRHVCIHHIDCDPTNNVRSNFACLCRQCHQLTHLLIEHADPQQALAWIQKTYPAVTL